MQQAARDVATFLSSELEQMPEFRLISRGDELPVFAFTTTDAVDRLGRLRAVPGAARARLAGAGVHLPGEPRGPGRAAGRLPQRLQSCDLAEFLLADVKAAIEQLNADARPGTTSGPAAFHH